MFNLKKLENDFMISTPRCEGKRRKEFREFVEKLGENKSFRCNIPLVEGFCFLDCLRLL